jgi:hypothetical protein
MSDVLKERIQQTAQAVWINIYETYPYISLLMIEYLMHPSRKKT